MRNVRLALNDSIERKNSGKKHGFIEWFSTYGTPHTIISDRGKEFLNEIIKLVCTALGLERIVTAAYNPRTNRRVERLNQTLINALRKHCENSQQSWNK